MPSQLVTSFLDDGTAGTLRYAIAQAAPTDTIQFDPSLAHKTIKLTQGELFLDKNLDIKGLGAGVLTVSGNHASRAFEVAAGHSVTIAGLTISDGKTALSSDVLIGSAGGILNAGTLTLRNDVLAGNEAWLTGGAVANTFGASLSVSHCTFTNNQALGLATGDTTTSGYGWGGALMNSGDAQVADSTFTGNSASAGSNSIGIGGAIASNHDGKVAATLTVTGCTFTANHVSDGLSDPSTGLAAGGAIGSGINLESSNALTVSNCTFTGNVSLATHTPAFAGAIGNAGSGTLSVTGSTFTANQARGFVFGDGGAVVNIGFATVAGSTFTGNQAIGTGPGAEAYGGALSSDGPVRGASLTVTDCTLSGNLAQGADGADGVKTGGFGQGGAINTGDPSGNLTVQNCTIADNQAIGGALARGAISSFLAASDGGGIAVTGGTATITGSTVRGNLVRGGAGAVGGVGAAALGGGIEVGFGSRATISGCVIVGNSAQGGAGGSGAAGGLATGGGLDVSSDATSGACAVTVSDTVFLDNQALGGLGGSGASGGDGLGGGISVGTGSLFGEQDTSSLSISGSTISGNEAQGGAGGKGGHDGQGQGGGLYVATGASVKLKKTSITGNDASTSGDDVFGT